MTQTTETSEDGSRTGVVFVHGIGEQLRAETLLGWSAPIVRAVASWAAVAGAEHGGSGDEVIRSRIDFEGSDLPLVTIRVPAERGGEDEHPRQTWVLTEARWAQNVRPPTLETMIDWCGPRGVVASVVGRIVGQTIAPHDDGGRGPGDPLACDPPLVPPDRRSGGLDRALAEVGLSTFISVLVTVGLLVYAVLRALAGIVPYRPLRDAIDRISLDTFLTTWWGDVYVLLDDPIQAANIRGDVDRTIRALKDLDCSRIVLIGHSGGTIVSYMALTDRALTASADTFVTHGQAIGMARAIHRREGSSPTSPGVRLSRGVRLRGVTRWRDFHATHDPAPAGRLAEAVVGAAPPGTTFCDTEVWNRMSIAGDHGAYFDNDEEFVEGLLAEIETAGRPSARSRFAAGRAERIERRRQRVYILALWNRLMYVLPLIAIMAAFLLPSGGLITTLRDVAANVVTFVPGSTEVMASISETFPPPGQPGLVTAAASIVATFYIFAIAKAILPIGRIELWSGARRWFFFYLDFGVFITGVAIAWLVRAALSGDPLAAFRDLVARVAGDPPIRAALVLSFVVLLVLAVPELRTALERLGRRRLRETRFVVLGLGTAALAVAAYGIVVDEGIRTLVSATVVGLGTFWVLGRIGIWRWDRWDAAERVAARDRDPRPFQRRWIWVQFLTLGAIAASVAIGIAVGLSALVLLAAQALTLVLVLFVVADVAVRKETPAKGTSARGPRDTEPRDPTLTVNADP